MSLKLTIEPKVLFSYPSAKEFTYILKTVSEMVDEVALRVSEEGVDVKALDPGKIALLKTFLPPEAFQDFKAEGELMVGLSVSNLVKALKHIKKNDRITIAANEEFVEILLEGTTFRRYKFRNIEVVSEEVPEISAEYDVEGTVLANPLRTAINELANLTDTIGLTVRGEAIVLYDYESKKTSYRLSSMTGTLVSLNVKKEVDVAFDSEYLSKIVDVLRLGGAVDIKFGSEAPLYLDFTISGGGRVQFYLAAKIV